MERLYEKLLALIYEASLEPNQWVDFLDCFADAMNSEGSMLFLHDFTERTSTTSPSPNHSFVAHARIDEAFLETFQGPYSKVNVWLENARKYGEGVPVVSSQLYPDRELPKTEFFDGWLRPQGLFHSIGGSILQQSDISVRLTALRPRDAGPYSETEITLYRRLMPHLQRSLRIHWQLREEKEARGLSEMLLDRIPQAAVLLDETGKVLLANRRAETIFRQSGGPMVSGGRLTAAGQRDAGNIRENLNRARMGIGSSLRLMDSDSQRQWVVTFSALSTSIQSAERSGCVMALISEPNKPEIDDLDAFATLYGLTAAENRVLKHLLQQQSPQEIATSLHVSINTVRSQLRALFAKTQTQNQRELVKFCIQHPGVK